MLSARGKISTRQLFIICIVAIYSPIVRLSPSLAAKYAAHAGWISYLVSALIFIPMLYLLQSAFNKGNCSNLSELFEKSVGKITTKCIMIIYLIWLMILLALYTRYYASRLIVSIKPGANLSLISSLLLIVVFFGIKAGFEAFARLAEVFFSVFLIIFVVLFALLFNSIDYNNLYPVTHHDFIPILKGTYPVLGIWGYIIYAFFLGDYVNDKENIKYIGLQATAFSTVIGLMLVLLTIGVFNASVIERSTLPFFSAVKSASVLKTIERMESVLVAMWVFSDYYIISLFVFIIQNVLKSVFSLTDTKSLTSPLLLFAFVFSLYFALGYFELSAFSEKIGIAMNILTCFIIPAILIGIGKIRKTI
ncbi:MAG: Spore germination protein YndE [Firmicutes bacterium ADurb.Bin193]|nr:MAG: Spore germination protein YndE [Firmicutes bacterium ADurb.Bin193]